MAFVEINDNVTDYGDIEAKETAEQIRQNIDYLIDSMPVGSVLPIMTGLSGVPTPDTSIWRLCDGSAVTDTNSPMYGQAVPDYTAGRYPKGFANLGAIGTTGGSNTQNLAHSHGGFTDYISIGLDGNQNNDRFSAGTHRHPLSSDLSSAQNFEPIHLIINFYMKIK